jgi:flavin reductase
MTSSPAPVDIAQSQMPTPVDSKTFRNGMARLAAGVNIVTSVGNDGWCGFTASAVCSVTDEPPTLLVCMKKTAQSYHAIQSSRVLCVNTVAGLHEDLSMRFSGAGGAKDMSMRFSGADWTTLITGAPSLADATVSFDCLVVRNEEIGTHVVFFCEVVAIREGENVEGLVYFGRKFHRVTQPA